MKYHWKKLTSMLVAAILTFNMVGQTVVSFASDPNVPNGSTVAEDTIPTTPNSVTNPADPVGGQPTNPADPADPENGPSTGPADPVGGQPTDPADPEDGQTTDPADPVGGQPTDPVDPEAGQSTGPADPEDGQSTDPSDPEDGQDAAPEVKTITQITLPEAALNAALHTAQENLQLPTVLTVQVEGQEEPVELPVTWVCDNYNAELAGSYIFTAQLVEGYVLAEGISLPQAVGEVTIQAPPMGYETFFVSSFQEPDSLGISLFSTGSYTDSFGAQCTGIEDVFYKYLCKNPIVTVDAEKPAEYPIDISAYSSELSAEVNLTWTQDYNVTYDITPELEKKAQIVSAALSKAAYAVCYDYPEYSWILSGGFTGGYNFALQTKDLQPNQKKGTVCITKAFYNTKDPGFGDTATMRNEISRIVSLSQKKTLDMINFKFSMMRSVN